MDSELSDSTMAIGEFSRVCKIPISALRYYDEINLLKPINVDPLNQYRFYSRGQLCEANFIETWKSLGFTLSEIKCLMSTGKSGLAESCYKKQIIAMENEITQQQNRKEEMLRNLRLLNRFADLSSDETSSIARIIIHEEHILTLEDTSPFSFGVLMEKRKKLEALVQHYGLIAATAGAFLTTRFLETCEKEGSRILYQVPVLEPVVPLDAEIVKVPAHAALYSFHKGSIDLVSETIQRIKKHAEAQSLNIGKSVTCIYWIDSSITPDKRLHVTEIRIPLKKKHLLDPQAT